MKVARLLKEATEEFINIEDSPARNDKHTVYQWTNEGEIHSKRDIWFPKPGYWETDSPPADSKREAFMEAIINDDQIPLISNERGAARVLELYLQELSVEGFREGTDHLESQIIEQLQTSTGTVEAICPIVGVTFNGAIELSENLSIRPITDREKELILNHSEIGGGSLGVTKSIEFGALTHVGVYTVEKELQNPYRNTLSVLNDTEIQPHESLDELETTMRLFHSDRVHMGNQYNIDKTFYPVIGSAAEPIESDAFYVANPKLLTDTNGLVEYYHLITNSAKDEGLRIALNRLDSSYKAMPRADGIVDTIIGLEALLSLESSGSFKTVRRRASVLLGNKSSFGDLGNLSSKRHSTVHGDAPDVTGDDLDQARTILSTAIRRVLELQVENDLTREQIITELDSAIDAVIREQFDELVAEFDQE